MVLAAGVDSNKDVYPILVDSSGRVYVNLNDPLSVEYNDTIAAKPDGIGCFGKRTANSRWVEIPVAHSGDALASRGSWVVPVGNMTTELVEGTKITDGINNVDVLSSGGIKSLYTTPGRQECFHVHLCKEGIGADTGLMLIDLSNTVSWPHTHTGGIRIIRILMSIAASKLTDAKIILGWLSGVDATDGDVNGIYCWQVGFPGTNEPRDIDQTINMEHFSYTVGAANWFGPKSVNNVLFQTDVDLEGPDRETDYPSGNGDLVLYIDWTAGELDISCSIDYETFA